VLSEPRVDRTTLLADVQSHYGLTADSVEFLPVGWTAAAYVLRVGGERYFLKLWPGGRGAVDRLPFVQRLGSSGFRARVAVPLPTRTGELSARFSAGVVVLSPYLPGTTLPGWPDWPPAVLKELGRTLVELHTFEAGPVLPFRERFSIEIADELRLHLADRAVRPFRGEVLDQLERLGELQQSAREAVTGRPGGGFVACHTDLTGDNILIASDGRLSVLDWDEAQLAPPEQDLALLLHGEQPVSARALRDVLQVYPHDLHLDLVGFFRLRRAVEDFTARVLRLHNDDLSSAETADALDGLDRWGASQWRRLDEALAQLPDVPWLS
jgi:Ser/Thr protein kinase RdoA (MazF antagonist)